MPASSSKISAKTILKDLIISDFQIPSVEKGLAKLKSHTKDLEAIHIYINNLNPKHYNKKKYYNIDKIEILSRLDEWIYENLVTNEEFAQLLQHYRPLKEKLGFTDIDEYILDQHYRPKAIKILRQKNKEFDLKKWSLKRNRLEYERKTKLTLKDGRSFRFDFRNPLETLFILKRNGNKEIIAVGGSGGSLQRQNFTVATTVFYLLDGKKKIIPQHLLRYDSSNRFHYHKTFYKPVLSYDYGSNYFLDAKLEAEVRKYGIYYKNVIKTESFF